MTRTRAVDCLNFNPNRHLNLCPEQIKIRIKFKNGKNHASHLINASPSITGKGGNKEEREIMLISSKMNSAINEQIGNEFAASLQYTAIAAYFADGGLAELDALFNRQATEEREHALRFIKFLTDASGKLEIPAIPAPQPTFKSAKEAVLLSLNQEKTVTEQINSLVGLAIQEKDYITQNFLSWFVSEQLEEVSSMENLYKVITRAGEDNLIYVEGYLARHYNTGVKPLPAAATESNH
jgi:bacterioferritin B